MKPVLVTRWGWLTRSAQRKPGSRRDRRARRAIFGREPGCEPEVSTPSFGLRESRILGHSRTHTARADGYVEDPKNRRIEEIRLEFANGSWRDAGPGGAPGAGARGSDEIRNTSTTRIIRCLYFGSRRSLDRACAVPPAVILLDDASWANRVSDPLRFFVSSILLWSGRQLVHLDMGCRSNEGKPPSVSWPALSSRRPRRSLRAVGLLGQAMRTCVCDLGPGQGDQVMKPLVDCLD